MRILRYYDDIFEAHADREYLAAQGIPAEVFNQLTRTVVPISYANPTMRPYIGVAEEYFDRAREFIPTDLYPEAVCPDCGSGDIELWQSERIGSVKRFINMFGGVGLSLRREDYRCRACRKIFKL